MTQPIHTIVTHAGSFHADEVMAVALLERFYLLRPVVVSDQAVSDVHKEWIAGTASVQANHFYPDGVQDLRTCTMVVRSRDASLLKAAKQNPEVFVIDVGGELNRQLLNFDHHQDSMRETWPDGIPLSSTGLIWLWLKQQGHLSSLPDIVVSDVEDKLIRPLDAHDNGVAQFPLSGILASYNRSTANGDEQNAQFAAAKILMKEALENTIHSAELKHEAAVVIERQWQRAQAHGDTCVIIQRPLAYHDCTGLLKQISGDKADMIIIPGQGNRFSVTSVAGDTPFSSKSPCPPAWRGRADFEVSINNKPIMIRFAHKTGFKCVVEGTHKDAQLVARHIIAHNGLNAKARAPSSSGQGGTLGQRQDDELSGHGQPTRKKTLSLKR